MGKPVNIGSAINTIGEWDVPCIREMENSFRFSSDGLPGMGGLDIFCAKEINREHGNRNMKYPIKSSGDDYG